MKFKPDEVVFSPGSSCNLDCPHCGVRRSEDTLNADDAVRFVKRCAECGIKRVGFSGGEPFLYTGFLRRTIKTAVDEGLLFSKIMTNGVWWKTRRRLARELTDLRFAGYDGEICASFDVFHNQPIAKIAAFINCAIEIWKRPDVITMAYICDYRKSETFNMLKRLALSLGAKIIKDAKGNAVGMKSDRSFLRFYKINFEPVGKPFRNLRLWSGRTFKEDYCKGPGNVLFVLPDGSVKPCCGYATDRGALTIGNIKRDSPRAMISEANRNITISAIYRMGLSGIRRRLEKRGFSFPGKTPYHCFFCDFILAHYPEEILNRCIAG